MAQIMVDKAQVLGFDAGRTVTILSLPQGDFVGGRQRRQR
jgi:hypothetical protein